MDIYLKEYMFLAQNGNAALAVQEALHACALCPGATLHLGGGRLDFFAENAFQKEYYISNNDYSLKNIIFPLIKMKNITVDGEGAELFFHGHVLPFVIDQSENVVLKDFTVDNPYPFFFQAQILDASESSMTLDFSVSPQKAELKSGKLVFSSPDWKKAERDKILVTEFEQDTLAPSAYIPPYFLNMRKNENDTSFLSHMNRYVTPVAVSESVVRFDGAFGHTHKKGNYLVGTFSSRECPGIFGNNSKDILLQNVTLYSTASMGVICQMCENITLDHLSTVPRPGSGRCLSVNADSTHFVHCTGTVRYEGCTFTNMLDDAGNVHGNYLIFKQQINPHAVFLTFGHPQQRGINVFCKGDRIHVIDNRRMQPVATLTVRKAELLSASLLRLETEEAFPAMQEGYTVENFTRTPELVIHGCRAGNNRPRGFLPSTNKKITITENTFFSMSCGLHFTGDSNDWFESGPVEDVTISNNNFINSAYTGGPAIAVTPHVLEGTAPFHRNIVIENNLFRQHEPRFLQASHVQGLVFRNNTFVQDDALPAHGQVGENGIWLDSASCPDAEIILP